MKKNINIIKKCLCNEKTKIKSLSFKKLPITDVFNNRFVDKKVLLRSKSKFCEKCNHLFLGKQISSKLIYNQKDYLFISSKLFCN